MFDRIAFVLGETLIALKRNFWLALAAITTMALSFYLLAGLLYVGHEATGYLDKLPGRFEMEINLKPEVTYEDVTRTAKYLRLLPGVAHVVWLPADRQYALWKRQNPEISEGLGDESPFAEKFRVRLDDLAKGDAVAATAKRMTTVDPIGGVQYFQAAQSVVASWIPLLRTFALASGGILLGVTGILVYTAIRLTVESRRAEVRIMRLVGASRLVVGLPFVLEGAIQGATGGSLATFALRFSHHAIDRKLADVSIGASLAPFPFLTALIVLLSAGTGYGAFCSTLSLLATLRARRR